MNNISWGFLIVQPYGHRAGHPSIYTRFFSESLAELGINVYILSFSGFILPWVMNKRIISIQVFPNFVGNFINFLKKSQLLSKILFPVDTLITCIMASIYVNTKGINFIHFIDGEEISIMFSISKFLKNKNILFNLNPYHKSSKSLFSRYKYSIFQRYYIKSRQNNKIGFITHSDSLAARFPEMKELLKVIPWGNEYDNGFISIRGNFGHKFKTFLIIGPNHNAKSYETIFRSFLGVEQKCILIFAGRMLATKDNPIYLKNKFHFKENKHKVIVKNSFVPELLLAKLAEKSDAIILSYKKSFRGASGALSYAIRYRKPVIASRVGQIQQILEENDFGILFEPENFKDLTKAINSFLNKSKKQILQWQYNLNFLVEKISWTDVAKLHIDFIKALKNN